MMFTRIAAQYTRASFVKAKTAPLFLTILWPLIDLSGTNLKVGPGKRLGIAGEKMMEDLRAGQSRRGPDAYQRTRSNRLTLACILCDPFNLIVIEKV